ncbi:hypothetical protein CKY28_17390 [Sphingomonas lenta]|uniref:Excalibur calcium-binding domain-containing protein n=1 Tax=Sphingomonas lenta TaxID=1141887 RepID=A0A2A2SAU6_9SPHN|nr:hypothetical protein CKY28_17390 [Sphingomonas lenta]
MRSACRLSVARISAAHCCASARRDVPDDQHPFAEGAQPNRSTRRRTAARRTARKSPGGGGSVYHANCSAARVAGAAPVTRGESGYSRKLDHDNDGVGCE